MGNKASAQLLPSLDDMLKTFSPAEVQALEARFPTAPLSSPRHQQQSTNHGSSGSDRKRNGRKQSFPDSTLALVTEAQFVALLGEGYGPSVKRLLLRLFAVLDTNGTSALEYQEHVGTVYFFNHATATERARVLFYMYEPTSSSSSPSPFATAVSKAHLSREQMTTLCAEITLAVIEMQAIPSLVFGTSRDGKYGRREAGSITSQPPSAAPAAAKAAAAAVSLTHTNATDPPFKDLIGVMVDVAFLRWDADKDGKLILPEFQGFVTQQIDNGVEELFGMLLNSPQVPRLLFYSDGEEGRRRGGERGVGNRR